MHLYQVWKISKQTDYVPLDRALQKNRRHIPVLTTTSSTQHAVPSCWMQCGPDSTESCEEVGILQEEKRSVFLKWGFNTCLKPLLPLQGPSGNCGSFVHLSDAAAYYRIRNDKYAERFDVSISLNSSGARAESSWSYCFHLTWKVEQMLESK